MVSKKIIQTDIPKAKLKEEMDWAEDLGGKVTSVQQEPDGEYTMIVIFD